MSDQEAIPQPAANHSLNNPTSPSTPKLPFRHIPRHHNSQLSGSVSQTARRPVHGVFERLRAQRQAQAARASLPYASRPVRRTPSPSRPTLGAKRRIKRSRSTEPDYKKVKRSSSGSEFESDTDDEGMIMDSPNHPPSPAAAPLSSPSASHTTPIHGPPVNPEVQESSGDPIAPPQPSSTFPPVTPNPYPSLSIPRTVSPETEGAHPTLNATNTTTPHINLAEHLRKPTQDHKSPKVAGRRNSPTDHMKGIRKTLFPDATDTGGMEGLGDSPGNGQPAPASSGSHLNSPRRNSREESGFMSGSEPSASYAPETGGPHQQVGVGSGNEDDHHDSDNPLPEQDHPPPKQDHQPLEQEDHSSDTNSNSGGQQGKSWGGNKQGMGMPDDIGPGVQGHTFHWGDDDPIPTEFPLDGSSPAEDEAEDEVGIGGVGDDVGDYGGTFTHEGTWESSDVGCGSDHGMSDQESWGGCEFPEDLDVDEDFEMFASDDTIQSGESTEDEAYETDVEMVDEDEPWGGCNWDSGSFTNSAGGFGYSPESSAQGATGQDAGPSAHTTGGWVPDTTTQDAGHSAHATGGWVPDTTTQDAGHSAHATGGWAPDATTQDAGHSAHTTGGWAPDATTQDAGGFTFGMGGSRGASDGWGSIYGSDVQSDHGMNTHDEVPAGQEETHYPDAPSDYEMHSDDEDILEFEDDIDDDILDATIQDMMGSPDSMPPTRRDFAVFLTLLRTIRRSRATDHQPSSPPSQGRGGSPKSKRQSHARSFDVRHDDPDHLRLKREVRILVAEILNLKESPINVPTPLQIKVFNKTKKQKDGPTLDGLKLNVAGKSVQNAWNKRAAALFSQHFIAEGEFGCKDASAVNKAFMSHLKTLQLRYHKSLRDEEDEEDLEFEMDMRSRRSLKSRINRRRGIRKRRSEACTMYAEIDPAMRAFIPIWQKLSYLGMSGDETDHEDGEERYVYTNLPWRNPARDVQDWFKTFDYLHLSTRFTADERSTTGKFPHLRIRSQRIEQHATPSTGLPRNFYNPVWLETLDDFEIRELDIQPNIDLSFSPNTQYIAARFSKIKNEKSKPIPRDHPSLPPRNNI